MNEMALAYDQNKSLNECLDEIGYKDHEAHLEHALKQVALNDMYDTEVKDDARLRNRKSKHSKKKPRSNINALSSASEMSSEGDDDRDEVMQTKDKIQKNTNNLVEKSLTAKHHDYTSYLISRYLQRCVTNAEALRNIIERALKGKWTPLKLRSVYDLKCRSDPLLIFLILTAWIEEVRSKLKVGGLKLTLYVSVYDELLKNMIRDLLKIKPEVICSILCELLNCPGFAVESVNETYQTKINAVNSSQLLSSTFHYGMPTLVCFNNYLGGCKENCALLHICPYPQCKGENHMLWDCSTIKVKNATKGYLRKGVQYGTRNKNQYNRFSRPNNLYRGRGYNGNLYRGRGQGFNARGQYRGR